MHLLYCINMLHHGHDEYSFHSEAHFYKLQTPLTSKSIDIAIIFFPEIVYVGKLKKPTCTKPVKNTVSPFAVLPGVGSSLGNSKEARGFKDIRLQSHHTCCRLEGLYSVAYALVKHHTRTLLWSYQTVSTYQEPFSIGNGVPFAAIKHFIIESKLPFFIGKCRPQVAEAHRQGNLTFKSYFNTNKDKDIDATIFVTYAF